MKYYSIRDLSNDTKAVCEETRAYGETVVTNNGKPSLLLIDLTDKDVEETINAFRQSRAMMAVNRMRKNAAANGYMSEEEINTEIKAARAARSSKKK